MAAMAGSLTLPPVKGINLASRLMIELILAPNQFLTLLVDGLGS